MSDMMVENHENHDFRRKNYDFREFQKHARDLRKLHRWRPQTSEKHRTFANFVREVKKALVLNKL